MCQKINKREKRWERKSGEVIGIGALECGWKFLEEVTTNAVQVQEQVLEEILSRNSNTQYLESFLQGESNKEEFEKKVPVVEYESIKPYMDRIAHGESPHQILTMEPIFEFLLSSGTSGGKQKLVPSTVEYLNKKMFAHYLIATVINKYIGGLEQEKQIFLQFVKPETKTPAGLAARFYTASLLKHTQRVYKGRSSHNETICCSDAKQSMYSQLLCGLVERDQIGVVGSNFASTVLHAINFLEDHWKEMCSNIRTGVVSDWITDPECRAFISRIFNKPDSNLADSIEQACSGKSWKGIVKKLWPKAKCIVGILTGSMAQYVPSLEYYSGGLPLLSPAYSSSECFFGINLNPLCRPSDVSYTLLPNMAYFEFLPVNSGYDDDDDDDDLDSTTKENIVGLADVKVGQCYEIVVTTITGLYRYRVGDIVKVVGYHNNAPKVQFSRRKGLLLCVDAEKTTEEELSKAVRRSMHHFEQQDFLLVDYTSYADTSSTPGRYVLFWELKMNESDTGDVISIDSKMMEESCFTMEESLGGTYKALRAENVIAPLEIRVVKRRTFDVLMEFFVSKGAPVGQYKTPRCIKSEEALKLLNSHVVGSFFSTKTPSI